MRLRTRRILAVILNAACAAPVWATADFVEHLSAVQVFGEPAGVTGREPEIPREDEPVELWIKIGFSFFYTDVAVYYTTDGSTPGGALGVGSGTTQVLRSSSGGVTFVRNQPNSPNNIDWWKATLPAATRVYGTQVRYRIGAWHSAGGIEVFANNYGCADNTCNDPANTPINYEYTVKLAWPGKGNPAVDHQIGYPPVYFWKEEGVVGNNYMNVMLDQNGSVYDIYYPSAGCVQGMGTKNEGYSEGLDTFPPGLPPSSRGQMNYNQAMAGIRVGGKTYWLSNQNGASYTGVTQAYVPDTNVIGTSAQLIAGGASLAIQQYDFCPKGVSFPLDDGSNPNRGIYMKRLIITNQGGANADINVYFYSDHALNGGDGFDGAFTDASRGAFVAYDRTARLTSGSGEYNPTTFSDYNKNVSVYLATAMKTLPSVGAAGGTPASEFWSDTSSDQDRGWVGQKLVIPAGQSREVNIAIIGGFDNFANATGTYGFQVDNAVDWFLSQAAGALQGQTEQYWRDWLAAGVTVDLPDNDYDELFSRGLLATALHLDGKNGGLIAGMHNGAYPFVWPRDAVYGAISLARTGHTDDAGAVYRYLRDVTFRANDTWGKGFWYQKYTTDGYIVWSAPQVDETSAVPWGVFYQYLVTGDTGLLASNWQMVYEAARASSEDSSIDARLYYNDPVLLMHSNNIWEDAFDTFIYSNASVVRGLRDASTIATIVGQPFWATEFTNRANNIQFGIQSRLDWNGENTDISQLGIVYPFNVIPANDARAALVVDRINGVARDRFGASKPLVNFTGEFQDLIDRYWCDRYWNGALIGQPCPPDGQPTYTPWFLSTAWYGLYYAERQDYNPGKGDIDNHKLRMDRNIDFLGPIGFGAEQMSPGNSLLYPGQTDFRLQTAWPNAWESMSTFVDAIMYFLDYVPNAPAGRFQIEPKLPTGWTSIQYNNLPLGSTRFDVNISEATRLVTATFTNRSVNVYSTDAVLRIPAGARIVKVWDEDAAPLAYTYASGTGRVSVSRALDAGIGASSQIRVFYTQQPGDLDGDGDVDPADLGILLAAWEVSGAGDLDGDNDTDPSDLGILLANWGG